MLPRRRDRPHADLLDRRVAPVRLAHHQPRTPRVRSERNLSLDLSRSHLPPRPWFCGCASGRHRTRASSLPRPRSQNRLEIARAPLEPVAGPESARDLPAAGDSFLQQRDVHRIQFHEMAGLHRPTLRRGSHGRRPGSGSRDLSATALPSIAGLDCPRGDQHHCVASRRHGSRPEAHPDPAFSRPSRHCRAVLLPGPCRTG